jgi:hypothetical protein
MRSGELPCRSSALHLEAERRNGDGCASRHLEESIRWLSAWCSPDRSPS